jgi:hypothetical protein
MTNIKGETWIDVEVTETSKLHPMKKGGCWQKRPSDSSFQKAVTGYEIRGFLDP